MSSKTATPRYQKPEYLCDISTPIEVMSGVYQYFLQRRGYVFNEDNIQAYFPVADSFWFTAHLRSLTSGQDFP